MPTARDPEATGGARSTAEAVAREAEANPALRTLARAGYAANGVVHLLIGVIVLVVTFGGAGESDQAGAFKAVAAAPLGFVGLWVLAIALWALGLYHAFEGMLVRERSAARKWGRRIGEWGQTVAFVTLGVIAAAVAVGARPDGDEAAEGMSATLLRLPGGPWVLGAVGLGLAVGGAVFVGMGFARSFRSKMVIPRGAIGAAVTALGIIGFVAKGIALAIVGVLLITAAVTVDADAAGGLDGAIQALLALPSGRGMGGAVGVGLLAYGLFLFARARWARL